MILWPIWLHSWAHGTFVPISKLFTCHKTLRQPQVTALQYHLYTATQGSNRHHTPALGMRFMYCSWLLCIIVQYCALFCALLCIIVHLFVLLCIQKSGQWTRYRIMFLLRCVIVTFSWKYTLFCPILRSILS